MLLKVGTKLIQNCEVEGYAVVRDTLFYVVGHKGNRFMSSTCTACTDSFLMLPANADAWLLGMLDET